MTRKFHQEIKKKRNEQGETINSSTILKKRKAHRTNPTEAIPPKPSPAPPFSEEKDKS